VSTADLRPAETFLGGRVTARQTAAGYRAAVDTVLLGAAIEARAGDRLIELGCGPGTAMLIAAAHNPGAVFEGVEIDPEAVDLANANAADSGVADRVAARLGDVAGVSGQDFDQAFFNPPYYEDPAAVRAPADPSRRRAFLGEAGALKAWAGAALRAVKPHGRVTLIHRADRLGDILKAFDGRAGDVRVRPVQSYADGPAKRVLVRARTASRAPLTLLPPLVLHEPGGGWTQAARAVQDGRARIAWDA
jgi:tRNA1(Val) A37 N6-methylase TrmN6